MGMLANYEHFRRLSYMKRIYLDHAAATPVDESVLFAMQPFFAELYANPSAVHKEGVEARNAIEHARKSIAKLIHAQPSEVVFTSSATESANLAITGAVRAWKSEHETAVPHIIISAIEHEAVFAPVRAFKKEGVRVTVLPVRKDGRVNPSELYALITEETVLIALMYANNEIGSVQPVGEAAKAIRKWKKEVRGVVRSVQSFGDSRYPLLYSDASQAPNLLSCGVLSLGVDLMTLSSGKIYGPKGAGLLYVSRGIKISPLLHGGGQEGGLRAGTENVPAVVGFARALEIASSMREDEARRLAAIQIETIKLLQVTFPAIIINGSDEERLSNIINFSFPDIDHEYLALALDARGFAVATKSACSETEAEISHVLLALREYEDENRPTSGIRVSMGRSTRREDMTEFVATLSVILETMFVHYQSRMAK